MVWDERPPGEDDWPMPVCMDWSCCCGAEDTKYIPGQAGPPARTCANMEVPVERGKAAGGVAARETNKAGAERLSPSREGSGTQEKEEVAATEPATTRMAELPLTTGATAGRPRATSGNRGREEDWPASPVSQHRGASGVH